jgi:Xaa-Pro aminopeptidase
VHCLIGPDRFALVVAGGPTILWEFAGCEHRSRGLIGVDELRPAPSVSAKKSVRYRDEVERFADEIVALLDRDGPSGASLATDRIGPVVVDALRERGIEVADGTLPIQLPMAVKQPAEVDAMRAAMVATEAATHAVCRAIEPGRTEQEVWAEFHRALIAAGGEFAVARLLQAGERTFPYFREASAHVLDDGDLVCFDMDAVGSHGSSVDCSRTSACGPSGPTPRQRELFTIAKEQLDHNAAPSRPVCRSRSSPAARSRCPSRSVATATTSWHTDSGSPAVIPTCRASTTARTRCRG